MGSDLSALALTVLGCALYLPQLLRLLRTRSVAGLSVTSLLNGSVAYVAWTGYLFAQHEMALVVATIVPGVVWWTVTGLALPRLRLSVRAFAGPAASATAFGAALSIGGLGWFGAVLAVSVAWSYAPAAVHAWRATNLHGLSALTWLLCAAEGAAWGVAGIAGGDRPLVVYGVLATVASAAVVAATVARPHTRVPLPA